MFGVDEGAHAAGLLRLGDVQGEGGLARGLGPEDLDHAPARQAAHAKAQVEPDRAGGNHVDVFDFAAEGHDGAFAKLFFNGSEGTGNGFQFLFDGGHGFVSFLWLGEDAEGEEGTEARKRRRPAMRVGLWKLMRRPRGRRARRR